MKKLIYYVAAGSLMLSACNNAPGYKITGTVEGAADGEKVYLQENVDGNRVNLDSAIISQGTFTFEGQQDETARRYLTYDGEEARYTTDFFLENGNIDITLAGTSKAAGTANNDIYQQFKDQSTAMGMEMQAIYQKARKDSTLTNEQREAIMNELEEKDSLYMEMIYATIDGNIGNPVGVSLLAAYSAAFEIDRQKALIAKVPEQYGTDKGVARVKERIELIEKTSEGKTYTDFSMNTPEGETVSLSDFVSKNKYTLVDFWASWCGPCRAEMPNVVAAYKAFKDKGFGIVGVSLDNNADKWKEAIKTLGITWPQMSDLKGWSCEGARLYGVNSIPATVLIDQEGTIVARNLRGEAIATKLKELLK